MIRPLIAASVLAANVLAANVLVALLANPAFAQIDLPDDPAARGLAIAEESERRDTGFGDSSAEMRMILRNTQGEESVRELRQRTLENTDPTDGDMSLIIFDRPRDVEGTALLTHSHLLGDDDQWLYLPAIARERRISSSNKSGPFLGSEFAFEDFSSQEVGKYDYMWLRDETCPEPYTELTCHVTERIPLYENSGYTRQIVWTDTTDYLPRMLEYYNRRNDLLKTLTFRDYRQYLGQFWRAHDLNMVNHLTGKSTSLTWSSFEFQTGLTEDDFSRASLRRAR